MTAQYVIGIDLGTTNSVLAYASLQDEAADVQLLPIPQLVAARTVESRPSLPSFLYVATDHEAADGQYQLPWDSHGLCATGSVARSLSAEFPERTISAAKSWLCHTRVDRRQPILPWQAPDSVQKLSPVAASRHCLQHLIAAWQQAFPAAPFQQQSIVLTVPASFDASARELTREAALEAGFPDSFLMLEEPQAATYSWLQRCGERWRKILRPADRMLVCDIGGGTTDLTLVEAAEDGGELALNRAAVGNHLLVGGDNMDLALAHYAASLFAEQGLQLDPWQSVSLWHACRTAKEQLLSIEGSQQQTISVPGRGRRLIGGLVSVVLERSRAAEVLLSGFFPTVALTDRPQRPRSSGFRELGLPWEADTAITRHLAAFLASAGSDAAVSHVLFNGGVFRSPLLRQRLLDQLQQWFPGRPPVPVDGGEDLDFAVARGACYYGWTRQHGGVRIRGGAARSCYVGIETAGLALPGIGRPLKALCVAAQGMEEGTAVDVPSEEVGLVVGEPARFRFFGAAGRKQDQPGDLLSRWSADELVETDSLEATLPADEDSEDGWVPVRFHTQLTELGILELWCVHSPSGRRWKLEFSVRDELSATP
ncbi:MAG TPA: Hsp70 family protein [Planctomycetaceae bacterium]|jgi:molecular chaperone DnaK (HSP70)|nr:Hsp70 family protein [Planctomycetaceae bacterium]